MKYNGLTSEEVNLRIKEGKINNEKIRYSRKVKNIIASNIFTFFNLINVILAILVFMTGSYKNLLFMVVVICNTFIAIAQEIHSKHIVDKLKVATQKKIKVIRDNEEIEIEPSKIVMDDLLVLTSGDQVVVDTTIISSNMCEVDESIITGESNAIIKKSGDTLLSGAIIVSGSCKAKVTSLGSANYIHSLIKKANSIKNGTTYLKESINKILKIATTILIPVGIILFISQYFFSNLSWKEAILSTVAGVIGMIPEGLVLLTSVALTAGVIKMAKKKTIIQEINGIETLACVDVLCFDKTGTITDGTMSVIEVVEEESKKIDSSNIIKNMLDDELVNATDVAMNEYFKMNKKLIKIKKIPFSSHRKFTSVTFKEEGSFALGALEYIVKKDLDKYQKIIMPYLKKGYRVVTLAHSKKSVIDKELPSDMKVVAFVILKDGIRENAIDTIKYFKEQGVNLKIISGDNPITVSKIASQIDFLGYENYVDATTLPDDFNELKKVVNNYNIFGRTTPEKKREIIRALKETKSVGMVGDGVNDILALKEADCSIALASGISAARSVSQIVLIDSDFSLLPEIVYEGRRVVNNIERVASLFLVKTTYSLLLSLMSIILTQQYPFYPIQLSLISTVCVGLPSFFLALEPNHTKVKRGFVRKVLRNAFPAGICVFLNILILSFYSMILGVEIIEYNLVIVTLTGMINLLILYKISLPLSLHRKVLLITCSIFFFGLLIAIPQVFQLGRYTWVYVAMIIALFIIDIYIIKGLEWLYDKISKKFIEI